MRILSISTSSNNCSVALLEDNNVIKELNIEDAKTHSEALMPLINDILEKTNITLPQIDYLACDIGPGSFTGIRIGISSIKAISEIHNIPICPISSLEGLAYQASTDKGLIVSLLDARNDQAYCGIFNNDYTINSSFLADSILSIIDILKQKNEQINFVGNASQLHLDLLKSHFPNATFSTCNTLYSSSIAKSAYTNIQKGKICNADELVPLYLRKSQAERMAESK